MRFRSLALAVAALLGTVVPARGAEPLDPSRVTIYNDSFGVPHIAGGSPEAMAYGAGYVVARDRLFETDVIRRLGQGRLSEVLGPGMLEADMVMRREFYDRADIAAQVDRLPLPIRRLLRAYADGFNTALAAQTANAAQTSALFAALGYLPEPWKPVDSATVLMLFTTVTFAGEGAGGELENATLLADLAAANGGDLAAALTAWRDLLVRSDPGAPAVVPHEDTLRGPAFISAGEPSSEQLDLALQPGIGAAAAAEARMLDAVRAIVDRLPMPKIGSYAMAADETRTASGGTILLGAPQAGFNAPSVFYELGLHAPGWGDCTGFTVPGLGPFIGIGWCNGHAWTLVAGNAGDQVDMIVEQLCADGRSYVFDGRCLPMTLRTERYLVRSTLPEPHPPEIVGQEIWSTRHGPVFRFDEDNGRAFVFRRAQAGAFVQTFRGTYALNTATSFSSLQDGARYITATYNFVYADDDGHIGYRFTGFQPVRAATIDHRLPTPGWSSAFEWQERTLRFERMPHVTNPAGGHLHVDQGIDSKPVWWWPRASDVFVGRFGHTRADRELFEPETSLDVDRVKQLNRHLISDVDILTPQLAALIDEALAAEPAGTPLADAYALFEAWRDAGYPRVDADHDGKLDDPALTIFSADGLNFRRSPLWGRFVDLVWNDVPGARARGPFVGRLGQTLAAIEDPGLFTLPWSDAWQADLRAALGATLTELGARFGDAPMQEWRNDAPRTAFEPIGLIAPPAMDVVDHGTYSQIVDLGTAVGVNVLPAGNGRADTVPDVALNQATGALPPHFADQIELYESFEFKPMKMTPDAYTADPESVEQLLYPGCIPCE